MLAVACTLGILARHDVCSIIIIIIIIIATIKGSAPVLNSLMEYLLIA